MIKNLNFHLSTGNKNYLIALDATCLQDGRLSWGAKGLLIYMLSLPANKKISRKELLELSTNSKEQILAYLKELQACGYIFDVQMRDGDEVKIQHEISAVPVDKDVTFIRDKKNKKQRIAFVPPTLEEVRAYCKERNNKIDPLKFFNYYADPSRNWTINGKRMKDWKCAMRGWESRNYDNQNQRQKTAWHRMSVERDWVDVLNQSDVPF